MWNSRTTPTKKRTGRMGMFWLLFFFEKHSLLLEGVFFSIFFHSLLQALNTLDTVACSMLFVCTLNDSLMFSIFSLQSIHSKLGGLPICQKMWLFRYCDYHVWVVLCIQTLQTGQNMMNLLHTSSRQSCQKSWWVQAQNEDNMR